MAAAVALTLLITLVPGRLGQFLSLGLQQFVEGFLYAASYQLLQIALDYFLVQLYNLLGHGLLSPFRMVCCDFILPECCKPCLLLYTFQFAKIIVPYPFSCFQPTPLPMDLKERPGGKNAARMPCGLGGSPFLSPLEPYR